MYTIFVLQAMTVISGGKGIGENASLHMSDALIKSSENHAQAAKHIGTGMSEANQQVRAGMSEASQHVRAGMSEASQHVHAGMSEASQHVRAGMSEVSNSITSGTQTLGSAATEFGGDVKSSCRALAMGSVYAGSGTFELMWSKLPFLCSCLAVMGTAVAIEAPAGCSIVACSATAFIFYTCESNTKRRRLKEENAHLKNRLLYVEEENAHLNNRLLYVEEENAHLNKRLLCLEDPPRNDTIKVGDFVKGKCFELPVPHPRKKRVFNIFKVENVYGDYIRVSIVNPPNTEDTMVLKYNVDRPYTTQQREDWTDIDDECEDEPGETYLKKDQEKSFHKSALSKIDAEDAHEYFEKTFREFLIKEEIKKSEQI